jgi:hypothetical protein
MGIEELPTAADEVSPGWGLVVVRGHIQADVTPAKTCADCPAEFRRQ